MYTYSKSFTSRNSVVCSGWVGHVFISLPPPVSYRCISSSLMMRSPAPRDQYQQLVNDNNIEDDPQDDLHHQLSDYLPPIPSAFGRVCCVV